MSTKITIGSCKSYEDIKRTYYDFNAVVDRIYDILHLLVETPVDNCVYIVDWKISPDEGEDTAEVQVKYRDKVLDGLCDNPEDFFTWFYFPARYLLMPDEDVAADSRRIHEEEEARQRERQKQVDADIERKKYATYLRLKEVYEGTEAVNGLPEKSPNL